MQLQVAREAGELNRSPLMDKKRCQARKVQEQKTKLNWQNPNEQYDENERKPGKIARMKLTEISTASSLEIFYQTFSVFTVCSSICTVKCCILVFKHLAGLE